MAYYEPDSSLVDPTHVTVLLSERDVAGQIPINFVTVPFASLKSACFADNIFHTEPASKCISNLLAIGFRRLSVDLYWSPDSRKWSFCPVSGLLNGTVSSLPTSSSSQRVTYSCSDDLDINSLLVILSGFFENTNSQVNVYTTYIILQLHVAAGGTAPEAPLHSLSELQLPTPKESIGYLLDSLLGMYIYRPTELAEERSNLNNSWYAVEKDYKPIIEYFTIEKLPDGRQRTPDGWPSAKYVQLAKRRRVLFGYGSIDPLLKDSNAAADSRVLFPSGYLTSQHNVSVSNSYAIESGCLYRPGASLVSQVNSSWAVSNPIRATEGPFTLTQLDKLSTMVMDLVSCGISPFLGSTIFKSTAEEDIDLYRNISLSTSWAWAAGEPRDSTDSNYNRCAIMDLTLGGHWRATNCSEDRPTACRVANMPYTWILSNRTAKYFDGSSICPDGSTFAVPRTGLENSYLFNHAIQRSQDIVDPSSSDPAKREIWLDFNSLDISSCWVTGGPDSACPYASDPQQLKRRTVLVSTIAGIVICIIAALTLFVKCNANRRNSRRQKRVIRGWEYEGIPS